MWVTGWKGYAQYNTLEKVKMMLLPGWHHLLLPVDTILGIIIICKGEKISNRV